MVASRAPAKCVLLFSAMYQWWIKFECRSVYYCVAHDALVSPRIGLAHSRGPLLTLFPVCFELFALAYSAYGTMSGLC